MSVLIINGSPRADGTVARILHIIEAEAERRGQADVPPGAPGEKMRGSACSESRSPAVWILRKENAVGIVRAASAVPKRIDSAASSRVGMKR